MAMGMYNSHSWNLDLDQLFNDLIYECEYVVPLTYALTNRLEKYERKMRKYIVSRMKDGCAPLFIACKRGHVEMVEYLIKKCDADIEQRGKFEIVTSVCSYCVTPLWCAAASGHLEILKCLTFHGADINAVSDSGSTPVQFACFEHQMGLVPYLVENGADILKASFNGVTCLMNSVGNVELCTFLLEHGADVNATDVENKSALHYAIEEVGCLETTKLLLKYKADPHLRSCLNDDALQTACFMRDIEIFNYLVENISYSMERLIDAYELMGATFSVDDMHMTLYYLRKAMILRTMYSDNVVPLPKRPVLPKREAYKNATEFSNLDELNAISFDLDAIRIQSFLIYERILHPHHQETILLLMCGSSSYERELKYQHCIDLSRRALEIMAEKDSIFSSYFDNIMDTDFVDKLVRNMINLNEKILAVMDRNKNKRALRFCDVVAIFKLLSNQLTEAKELLQKRLEHKKQRKTYDGVLKCVTHLIYLLVKTASSNEEKALMHQLVRDLVTQNPISVYTEDTLLHLCVSRDTFENRSGKSQIIFPCLDVVKLLLDSGASVDARNILWSTPLHVASNAHNFHNSLIKLLLDYNAHLDIPNREGETPARLISTNPLNGVNLFNYTNLQCLAAQAICKAEIPNSNQEIVRQLLMGKMGKKPQPSNTSPPYPQPPPSMPPPSMPSPIPNVAFGNKSQHMTCPHCHANISTRIESEANTKTHLIAILLCACGCCCCAPCAYCMNSCTVKKHYCPGCGSYLGQSNN